MISNTVLKIQGEKKGGRKIIPKRRHALSLCTRVEEHVATNSCEFASMIHRKCMWRSQIRKSLIRWGRMDINHHTKMFMKCHLSSVISHVLTLPKKVWIKGQKQDYVSNLQAKWISDNLCSCWNGEQQSVIPPNWTPVFLLFSVVVVGQIMTGRLRLLYPPMFSVHFLLYHQIIFVPSTKRDAPNFSLQKPQQNGKKWNELHPFY